MALCILQALIANPPVEPVPTYNAETSALPVTAGNIPLRRTLESIAVERADHLLVCLGLDRPDPHQGAIATAEEVAAGLKSGPLTTLPYLWVSPDGKTHERLTRAEAIARLGGESTFAQEQAEKWLTIVDKSTNRDVSMVAADGGKITRNLDAK